MKEQECFPNRLGRVRGFRKSFTISAGKWSLLDLNIQRMKFRYHRLNLNWAWIRRSSGLKNTDTTKGKANHAAAFMKVLKTYVGFMISRARVECMKSRRLYRAALAVK